MNRTPAELKTWRSSMQEVDARTFRVLYAVACRAVNKALVLHPIFADPANPYLTARMKLDPNDIEIGRQAFPFTGDGKITHITILGENHPDFVNAGIVAVVGCTRVEAIIQLWEMSTDNVGHWITNCRDERPIENSVLSILSDDLASLV